MAVETSHIYGIDGPVVFLKGETYFAMGEQVFVGEKRLMGEVIGLTREQTTIQVFENTTGLRPGEPVEGTGHPLWVLLAPGILGHIFDGLLRPLTPVASDVKWKVHITVSVGRKLKTGMIFAEVPETASIVNRVLVPQNVEGEVIWAAEDGDYMVREPLLRIKCADGREETLCMESLSQIRVPRPVRRRHPVNAPLVTGQRILDSLFPIAKGGTAAMPGGFGTGKTMTQHQLAKWCNADIIVYIGCGERGNEMTNVLEEFQKLTDPKTGNLLMERTVLIANTSNMPVAAREAGIYTGMTVAEYYRDMGYDVAVMADSTSRFAEALRELSGRMEEMPAEEGFPAYLASRLASFYERAGEVETLGGGLGSITVIGAVSPQGGDFSEPVTQNTKRFVRCFLALDKSLAYARHYPAINWMESYSEYAEELKIWYEKNVGEHFFYYRARLQEILAGEARIKEIATLIGSDMLPEEEKVTLETARVIRLGFLQQDAFLQGETFVPLKRQYEMMKTIVLLYENCMELASQKIPLSVMKESGIFEKVIAARYSEREDAAISGEMIADWKREIGKEEGKSRWKTDTLD